MFNKILISLCIIIPTIIGFIITWTMTAEMISSKNDIEVLMGIIILLLGLGLVFFIFNKTNKYLVSSYKKIEEKKRK